GPAPSRSPAGLRPGRHGRRPCRASAGRWDPRPSWGRRSWEARVALVGWSRGGGLLDRIPAPPPRRGPAGVQPSPILEGPRRSGPPAWPSACSPGCRPWRSGAALPARPLRGLPVAGDQGGVDAAGDDVGGDHTAADVVARRQVVLDVEEDLLEDRPQAAGARAALDRLVGDRLEGVVGELQLHPVELEELAVLLDQGVLGLDEDA